MQNPFRSEAEAYRLLLVTGGVFAAVVIAEVAIGTWGAVGGFLLPARGVAYRLVLLTVGFFAAIVIAKVAIGTWAALVVFLVLAGVFAYWILRTGKRERPIPTAPAGRHPETERRILVIANETVGGQALRDC